MTSRWWRAASRIAIIATLITACSKSSTTSAAPSGATLRPLDGHAVDAAVLVRDPEVDALWTAAKEANADDLARLAQREGAAGLTERGDAKEYRATAIRALAYVDGFAAFPWLVSAANAGDEADRAAALDAIATWAARPRRAVDPEDAIEMREGCDALFTFAKDAAHVREERVVAVRALRMLADRGCKGDDASFAGLDAK